MPKVDVIIPAYNAAKYLPTAIESVVAQTFEDWRILLVDDGSTDDTAEVVSPYVEQLGPKLKYIKQNNKGLPAARNTAIRKFLCRVSRIARCGRCVVAVASDGISEVLLRAGRRWDCTYGFNSRIDPEGAVIDTFANRQRHGEGRIARVHLHARRWTCLPYDHVPQRMR